MTTMNSMMRSTAIAVLLSGPFAGAAAFAQETTGNTDQAQPTTEQAQQPSEQSGAQSGAQSGSDQASSGQMPTGQDADAVVATVGDAEILGSDVMTVIGLLPPQLQSQPPQMLVPMALQQLILRELVLEQARSQNLSDDPEVVALVGTSAQTAEEDAMVQVWLDRETANYVTDEAVQGAYDEAQAQGQQDLPPVEEVRPQIEQYLRAQAMQAIQSQLQQDAAIVLYDAMGQPIEQPQGDPAGQGQGTQSGGNGSTGNASGSQSGSNETSGGASDGQSTGGSGGSADTTGTAPPAN